MAMQPVGSGIKIVRFVDEDEASIDVAAWRREQIERSNRYMREVRPDLVTPKPAPKASPAPRAAQPPKAAPRPQVSQAQQVKALSDEIKALGARLDAAERAYEAKREQARRDQRIRVGDMFRW